MQMSYTGIALCFVACAVFAASVRANPDYVRRPQGWFILLPPLSKPDPLTGAQSVDEHASQKRWSAMVIRGRDGHDYDFAGEDMCKSCLVVVGVNLSYNKPGVTFPRQWLAKSRCAKDDYRKSVMTDHYWSEMMRRYIEQATGLRESP
jgi:hypothetical protein